MFTFGCDLPSWKKSVSVLGKKWAASPLFSSLLYLLPPTLLHPLPSPTPALQPGLCPLCVPPPFLVSLMTSRCARWVSLLAPSWGGWVCASTNTRPKLGSGGLQKYNIRGRKKKNFEVLRMKLVKIILDGDRPIYVPRKRNVLRKLFPWTLWVLVNTFQPCDWKSKPCDPQQGPQPEIIPREYCVCLQMVLDRFSWMPHFPKARNCYRESFQLGEVLCSKSKVLYLQENV